MQNRIPPIINWLVTAALVDWLITRTIGRAAIFMPKSQTVLTVFNWVISIGQFASMLTAVLALLSIVGLAWRLLSSRKYLAAGGVLASSMLSVWFLITPPNGGIALTGMLIQLGVLAWFGTALFVPENNIKMRIASITSLLALAGGSIYHALQTFTVVFHLNSPQPFGLGIFYLGELFVVLTPIGLLLARWSIRSYRTADYLIAAVPAILFLAGRLINPAMTGILVVWSTGLTLYLPLFVYSISIFAATLTIRGSCRAGDSAGLALILLAAGGYAPQLSHQIFLGWLGLSLLAGQWHLVASTTRPIELISQAPLHAV